MFGLNLGRQRPGRPVSAGRLNDAARVGERTARLTPGPGLGVSVVAGTPLLRLISRAGLIGFAVTPAEGIPGRTAGPPEIAPGAADCTLLTFQGDGSTKGGPTAKVLNLFGADCPGDALAVVARIFAFYVLLGWECG